MRYTRLIACGDSFTEGMSDEVVNGQYRGWADRVADVMAEQNPNYKPEVALALYAQTVRKIAASGATVLLFTVLERTDREGKTADLWAARFGEFNKNVRAVAKEVGVSHCPALRRCRGPRDTGPISNLMASRLNFFRVISQIALVGSWLCAMTMFTMR